MRIGWKIIAMMLFALTGCAQPPYPVSFAEREIAVQRARYLLELVCVSNRNTRAQERALDAQGLHSKNIAGGQINYADPGAMVFASLFSGPVGALDEGGAPIEAQGDTCAISSPALSIPDANRILQQIVATRYATSREGAEIREITGIARESDSGGLAFFWQDMGFFVTRAAIGLTDGNGQGITVPLTSLEVVRFPRG